MKLDKAHILFVFIVGIFITINFFNLSKYGMSRTSIILGEQHLVILGSAINQHI
jgi:hypothetical protein